MAKLIDFLREQAIKAGVNVEDENHKTFFSTQGLADVEIPDALVTLVKNGLISLPDAKNNHPEIKALYTKAALDGLDKKIEALIDSYELDADSKNIVLAERNSYARPDLLIQQIIKKEQAKAAEGKPQLASLQKTIDDLNAALRLEKKAKEDMEAASIQKDKDLENKYEIDSMLSSYQTVYDDLEPKVRSLTFHTLLKQTLQKENAKFDRDEAGNLILVKNDGSNVYGEGNQQVFPKGLIEKVLSANKLLKVGPPKTDDTDPTKKAPPITIPGKKDGTDKGATPGFKNLMSQALKDIQPAT